MFKEITSFIFLYSEDIPQFLKPMDNKHNSLNLAAKICSDICPCMDIICSSNLTVFLELLSWKTVRFLEQIMSAGKYPSIFSCQMKAIVYLVKSN